ncbi:hypothetical protein BGZ54_010189 [Gamsiella multidivaricata]|nr:hypothetical protein BGZ54_010189 [Gamsiella multidivaricata]
MSHSEADSAVHQQSKRLAGLSITNATGAKVSILNDSSTEHCSSPRHQPSPRLPLVESPHPQGAFGRRDTPSEEHTQVSHHSPPRFQPLRHHQQNQQREDSKLHPESCFEAGRSSSLTNASTPIYSSLEMANSKSPKGMLAASQRSRSLSSGSALSPKISTSARPAASSNSPASVASPTYPFSRSYSEDNHSDDSESCQRMSDPNSANASGTNVIKRKYSCSFPGCNKCFTTSGHLARHNRIHTGERNFACLMPGCPSKFSRQDNMMQHYRTHISPKSRRGASKKQEGHGLDSMANSSQETLVLGGEHSPVIGHYVGEHEQQHQHIAKLGGSRQGSRQSSPPRFNPFDRSGNAFEAARHSSESYSSSSSNSGGLRHKNSGTIQTHQHHTPMPHFNVQAVSTAHQHGQGEVQIGAQGTLPSPLTPTIAQAPVYHQQPAYVPPMPHVSASRQHDLYTRQKYGVDGSQSPSIRHRSDSTLASPTSPQSQDVERMEGVAPSAEHNRYYSHHDYHEQQHAQQQYPQQYQTQASSGLHQHQYQYPQRQSNAQHAGHAQPNQPHSNYQLPPLSVHGQDRKAFDQTQGGHLNAVASSLPQSTPHTPTKHRFDPIHDCLQQDKQHHHHHHNHQQRGEHRDSRTEPQSRYLSHYHSAAAAVEDEDMSSTTRSSIVSSASSMTSVSSASSNSVSAPSAKRSRPSDKQEPSEEMSGLAHLAQIVTTYG